MVFVWGGVTAYFFLFWYVVGTLELALAGTLFWFVVAAKIHWRVIKAREEAGQSQPDQTPEVANLNRRPR